MELFILNHNTLLTVRLPIPSMNSVLMGVTIWSVMEVFMFYNDAGNVASRVSVMKSGAWLSRETTLYYSECLL